MANPRYKPRSHYRTRQSTAERSSLEPSGDFGATSLDRPRIDLSELPPASLPSPPRRVVGPTLPYASGADRARMSRARAGRTRLALRVALAVLVLGASGGAIVGAALALARC